MLNVYIGYDKYETAAYHVLAESIISRASGPVAIIPLKRENLKGIFTRDRGPLESTDFSISRFLVPHLNGPGRAVFMDCDMLCMADIYDLIAESDKYSAVSVVKHSYIPKTRTKFLGQAQTPYAMKNWSSLMVFNCGHFDCQRLTPEIVNTVDPLWLHQFQWARNVGQIPGWWNHLVGEYAYPVKTPKLIHYTLGGPWFDDTKDCEYADLWLEEARKLGYGIRERISKDSLSENSISNSGWDRCGDTLVSEQARSLHS